MSGRVEIGGIDRTSYVRSGTLHIRDAVNANSIASFGWRDDAGLYRPAIGELVEIYDEDDALVFGGSIDEPREIHFKAGNYKQGDVECVDHHHILNRRLVAETYEAELAGNIVKAIITDYLTDDGIAAGTIHDGPMIAKAVFNYLEASQCLNELSSLTGFQWLVRPNKALDFFDRNTYAAPWTVNAESAMKPVVSRDRRDYRNRQYIRAGRDISDVQTRNFKGDGASRVWTVDLPIAAAPTIKVNEVSQTVGIRGVETGFQFYWNKGDKSITQDEAETVLTSSDTLTIEYQGFYPILTVAEDPEAIDERVSVEGGSGLYEAIADKQEIDERDAAVEYSRGLLRAFARVRKTLVYETFENDLRPGMLQTVDLPELDFEGEGLISQIETWDVGGLLRRRVTVLDGEDLGGWRAFYQALLNAKRTFTIRENEVLVRLAVGTSAVTLSDEVTTALHDYLVTGTHVYAGVWTI